MSLPPDSNNSSSSSVVVARIDIRIRIKLEIPSNVGDESRKQIKGILEKIFEDNSLPFELQHEEVPLSTIENLFYLSTYEITIDPLKRKKVMDMTKVFFRKIEALELPPEKYPLLVISSGEAFWPHLIVEHPFVEVSAIMWGNILGGVFLNHWEVSRNRLTNPSTNDIREFINCSFKYDDEEHLVNVTFQCRVKDRDQETLVKYTVTISAAIVQRIIVEQNCTKVNFTDERTRIHFELFCPPFIYRSSVSKKGEEGDNIGFRQRTIKHGRRENQYPKDRLLSGCPYFTLELPNCHSTKLFEIISRLRARTKRSVEFGTFPIKDALIINEPYFRWLQTTLPERPECACNFDRSFQQLLDHCFSLQQYLERTAVTKSYIKVMSKRFTMTYLVEGLLSRGAVVMDQICMSQLEWEKFLELLARHTDNNFGRTERVLEKMLTMLDSKIRLGPFLHVFNGLFRVLEEEENNPLAPTVDLEREGYKRVRKVIITPTRVLYMIPEMMMANRALRLFDKTGTNIVRVSFRDDNMTKMNCNNPGENNIRFSVEAAILKDFKLANIVFGYLGSSNSQLRDHGGYFMQKMSALDIADWRKSREQLPMCGDLPPPEMMVQIETSREQLGKFLELKNVPKMIARMGQCFTQSRESGVVLPLENCGVTFDYVGGANRFGEVYTYSDGAGLISMEFASSVSKQLGLKFVPSCFQVRYRGHKGILVVNPDLDSDNAWVKKNKYRKRDSSKEKVHVAWRDSQNKFHGAMQKELEIVKWASPCPVALNKPLINIMDQVSGLQGIECQQKMSDTIEKLLDKHIRGLGTQLIDEAACRNRLAEMPSLFDYELLSQAAGFELCTEVFFRLLVKCSITFSITKQLYKGQIHVPGKLGRTCFGVPDDSGQLQYGQVFIQISTNVSAKNLSNKSAKEIIKGDVLITKNPCVVPGDIRKFQAVDIPELHHLTDVVVFPIYGPRPHPDEMAGSDLDGDEYCIFWHKGLLIERNEEAFDFSSIKREDDMSKINVFLGVVCHLKVHKDSDFTAKITRNTPHTRQQQEELAKFLIRYMTHDSVGQIATAHLRNADQHGLSHPVCMGLAAKHSQAVDFAKNGILPDKLTVKPSVDEETGIHLPAEAVERVPDFHWAAGKPTYRSSRLLGKLNREIEKIADILRLSEDLDEQIEIKTDPYILVEDWERYAREAKTALRKYNNKLTSILESYGINSEAEIVSGCIMSMRNKLSDKEDDDMSFFNTSQIVSTIFFEMFSTARKDFFEEFGGWKVATDFVDKPYNDENNICNRRATQPTEAMKQKAVAYYRVCYEAANNSDTKQLSFAWLAYDILSLVKRANIIVDPNYTMIGDPLTQMLSERIDKYVEENKDNFEEFKTFDWVARNSRLPVKCIEQLLNKYCDVYQGLDKFLFIVTDWGKNLQLTAGHFTSSHLSLLSIMFLTNRMSSLDGDALQILTPLSRGEDREQEQFRAIAQPMLKFFEFVASRKMTVTKKINFEDIGIPSFLLSRGEWMDVHQAAIAMYYNMVFNLRIDGLPLSGESLESGRAREMPPFIMEIPDNENFTHSVEDIRKILKRKSGVEELQIRTLKKGRDDPRIKCRLSARGTLTAIAKLKKLTTALYPKYTEGREHRIQELMPRLVLEQIIKEDVVQNDLPL